LAPTTALTADGTAAPGDFTNVDTTNNDVTVTLQAAPPDGTRNGIKHTIQGGNHKVTVALSGTDVVNKTGGVTSFTLPFVNQAVVLQYFAAVGVWIIVSLDLGTTPGGLFRVAHIETGAGTLATLDTGVLTLPGTYVRLMWRLFGRSDTAATADSLVLSFNGDTADANYDQQRANISNATVSASAVPGTAGVGARTIGAVPGATAPTNHFGFVAGEVADFAGANFKIASARSDYWTARTAAGSNIRLYGFQWANAAAINRLAFSITGNFVAGTKLDVYAMSAGG
jgi:hypothetical protein